MNEWINWSIFKIGLLEQFPSSNSSGLAAPFSSTVESGMAYRRAAPLAWNALSIELLTMLCINDFKKI